MARTSKLMAAFVIFSAILLGTGFVYQQELEVICRNWVDGDEKINCDKCRTCVQGQGSVRDYSKCASRCRADNCKCRAGCETEHH